MIITLGSFDGVHLGHQALLARAKQEAHKRRLKSKALVFKIPPRMLLNPSTPMALLSSPEEKKYLLRHYGINEVEMLEFGKKISKLPAFVFLRDELVRKRGARGIVIGSDFRFGVGRSAGALEMVRWGQEFEIPVWVVPPVKRQGKPISSTAIREFLAHNQYKKALGFLGHSYVIAGKVVKGQSIGKKLGFPTANIEIPQGKILPRGVFVVKATVSAEGKNRLKSYGGVCNIGFRPTLGKKNRVCVEAHLFGEPGALRGKILVLELLSWLRGEKKFDSLIQLVQAIKKDVKKAKDVLFSGK